MFTTLTHEGPQTGAYRPQHAPGIGDDPQEFLEGVRVHVVARVQNNEGPADRPLRPPVLRLDDPEPQAGVM